MLCATKKKTRSAETCGLRMFTNEKICVNLCLCPLATVQQNSAVLNLIAVFLIKMTAFIGPVVLKAMAEPATKLFGSICSWIQYIAIAYALMIIGVILPLRYAFLGDQVDCVMDGLQNSAQLQNESYLQKVQSFCGVYGVPPNYVRLNASDSLFARIEPRNQTFVESVDYFLVKEEMLYKFRKVWFLLIIFLITGVNLLFYQNFQFELAF